MADSGDNIPTPVAFNKHKPGATSSKAVKKFSHNTHGCIFFESLIPLIDRLMMCHIAVSRLTSSQFCSQFNQLKSCYGVVTRGGELTSAQ